MNGKRPPAAIVLLSDGASTGKVDPVAAAQAARKLHIPIYTVALGTAQGTITVPRPGEGGGTETRQRAARPAVAAPRSRRPRAARPTPPPTRASSATSTSSLGSQLGTKNEKRQITAGFAGGGLALLLLGAAMSLRWFGRLI